MNVCNDGHDEVCYDGYACPCCDLIVERDEHESNAYDLQCTVDELEEQVSDLECKIEELDESVLVKTLRKIIAKQNAERR